VTKDFYVSEALLKAHVPEFAAIVETSQDTDSVVEIEDVEFETFHIFTKWLSAKSLDAFAPFGPLYKYPIGDIDWTSSMPLLKLYLFACDNDILQLAEDASRRYASFFPIGGGPRMLGVDIDIIPTIDEICYIYAHTATDCPLREIVVQGFCAAGNDLDYSLGQCSREFLVDVVFRFSQERDSWKELMGTLGMEDENARRKRERRVSREDAVLDS